MVDRESTVYITTVYITCVFLYLHSQAYVHRQHFLRGEGSGHPSGRGAAALSRTTAKGVCVWGGGVVLTESEGRAADIPVAGELQRSVEPLLKVCVCGGGGWC